MYFLVLHMTSSVPTVCIPSPHLKQHHESSIYSVKQLDNWFNCMVNVAAIISFIKYRLSYFVEEVSIKEIFLKNIYIYTLAKLRIYTLAKIFKGANIIFPYTLL